MLKGEPCCWFITLDSSSLQPTLPPLSHLVFEPANCFWGSERVSEPWIAPDPGLLLTLCCFFHCSTEELFFQHLLPHTLQLSSHFLCPSVCTRNIVCALALLLDRRTTALAFCDGLEVCMCVLACECVEGDLDTAYFWAMLQCFSLYLHISLFLPIIVSPAWLCHCLPSWQCLYFYSLLLQKLMAGLRK